MTDYIIHVEFQEEWNEKKMEKITVLLTGKI